MANINAHLPSSIAASFHPPTENLQHDNLVKPAIPKTEIISSYTKLRDQESLNFSASARNFIQDGNKQADSKTGSKASQQRRSYFFARRGRISESENAAVSLTSIDDFKEVLTVIQARYKNAVSPLIEPVINYEI